MNHLTFLNHSYFSFVSSVDHLSLAAIRLYRQVADALCYLGGSASPLANLKLSHNYFTSAGSTLIKDGQKKTFRAIWRKAYFWWIESVLASHGPYL
jgi:hypothetical protein